MSTLKTYDNTYPEFVVYWKTIDSSVVCAVYYARRVEVLAQLYVVLC
jgi:hypothetical protein